MTVGKSKMKLCGALPQQSSVIEVSANPACRSVGKRLTCTLEQRRGQCRRFKAWFEMSQDVVVVALNLTNSEAPGVSLVRDERLEQCDGRRATSP